MWLLEKSWGWMAEFYNNKYLLETSDIGKAIVNLLVDSNVIRNVDLDTVAFILIIKNIHGKG